MRITIDTLTDDDATIKSAIGFLLHLRPGIEASEVPLGTNSPKLTAAPSAATSPATAPSVVSAAATAPATATTAPALASNVVNFPVPPPPASMNAATAGASGSTSTNVPSAAAAASVASAPAEYDSAGIPWDARIHQKAKGKKKDLTWKLIKGIADDVVIAVTTELMSRKVGTAASPAAAPTPPAPPSAVGVAPPPPSVFLPNPNDAGQQDTVPVPPVPSAPAAGAVPASAGPVAGAVPVPPVAPAGPLGVTYRSLIDKMTSGTPKLVAAKVLEVVTSCGCPNLQQLNQMPQIWPDVDAKLDLALAGLL